MSNISVVDVVASFAIVAGFSIPIIIIGLLIYIAKLLKTKDLKKQ